MLNYCILCRYIYNGTSNQKRCPEMCTVFRFFRESGKLFGKTGVCNFGLCLKKKKAALTQRENERK